MCMQLNPASRSRPIRRNVARAFTVAELMIVLIILGVVLSVVLPSIKHVNNRAKAAVTYTIMNSVASASGQFVNDNNGRNPGHYTAGEMGVTENEDNGLSGLQNILLDLMPGITAGAAIPGNGVIELDPGGGAEAVRVNLNQLAGTTLAVPGGASRSYFRPDPKYYFAAADYFGGGAPPPAGFKHVASVEGHRFLPDLHDGFGQPILGWQQDERADTPGAVFARANYDPANTAEVARFYWASNACFLKTISLGRLMTNQETQSMLGRTGAPGNTPENSLEAILGNPAFPSAGFLPTRARGPLVFHSAGANGIFLGVDERGAKISVNGTTRRPLTYVPGLDPLKGGDFDDIVISAGN
jgi:type II secretory pathway pseudopilin PulG